MDVSWQWGDSRANPADAAIGSQIYDNHLYYSYVLSQISLRILRLIAIRIVFQVRRRS